jgi:hypothetical protein
MEHSTLTGPEGLSTQGTWGLRHRQQHTKQEQKGGESVRAGLVTGGTLDLDRMLNFPEQPRPSGHMPRRYILETRHMNYNSQLRHGSTEPSKMPWYTKPQM